MGADYETLICELAGAHLLLVRLNRPERANAFNTRMAEELRDLWTELYVAPAELRCMILTGSGDKAFCAGGDLKERNAMSDAAWQRQHAVYEQMMRAMAECPLPIIAAVNGAAYGGGCELVLGADFAYAARRARFALTEVTLGIMPGAMGTQHLPRAVGARRARELIFTGRPFSAEQAHAWGMVNRVCEDDALLDEAMDTARVIAANAPIAVRQAKKSIAAAGALDPHSGYAFEIEAYNRLVPSEDRQEGVRAFNERREPRFKGR